jgi:hypothetical protein
MAHEGNAVTQATGLGFSHSPPPVHVSHHALKFRANVGSSTLCFICSPRQLILSQCLQLALGLLSKCGQGSSAEARCIGLSRHLRCMALNCQHVRTPLRVTCSNCFKVRQLTLDCICCHLLALCLSGHCIF